MKDVSKFALFGILGLGFVSVACGSKSGSTGTGGSNGSGGSGNGGSSATGGKGGSSASGGSNGTGGAVAPTTGCLASDAPATADIANFASGALDGGLQVMGGIFTYGDTPPPGYTLSPGSVEVMDNVVVSAKNHYQGFGIYFNGNTDGTDCVDASQYTGVQFDIKGSLVGDGCTVQFSINDAEHADMTVPKSGTTVSFDAGVDGGFMPQDPKASGPKGAYAPQLQIGPMIMSGTTTIQVPFSGAGAPMGGLPTDTPIDTKRIEGVQWQLTTPLPADGGATECDLDITITNVKFYK